MWYYLIYNECKKGYGSAFQRTLWIFNVCRHLTQFYFGPDLGQIETGHKIRNLNKCLLMDNTSKRSKSD